MEGASGLELGMNPKAVLILIKSINAYMQQNKQNETSRVKCSLTDLLSERSIPLEILIVRSYCTLTGVFRSRKVSGSRHGRISPAPKGTVTVRGRGIERRHTQCPSNLLDAVPSESDGIRGVSIDFAQMGCVRLRNTKQSLMLDPVMIRPVTCMQGHSALCRSSSK